MADSETVITPYRDGPLLVRGAFKLLDQDGNEIELAGRERRSRCADAASRACGRSATAPTTSSGSAARAAPRAAQAPGEEAVGEPPATPRRSSPPQRLAGARSVALEQRAGAVEFVGTADPVGRWVRGVSRRRQDLADGPAPAGAEIGEVAVEAVQRAAVQRFSSIRQVSGARSVSPASCARPASATSACAKAATAAASARVVWASHTRSSSVP